ncbi:MAG: sigma-E processing peptidase SpoIIGA [Clostridiales bacterium]|nr:sigma-E processing peptidase SpoIIGA [Clostridiales bacterium]
MELEVYADIIFLINLAMDFLILVVAGKIARAKAKVWRLAAAAALMSVMYCAIVFVPDLHMLYHAASSVAMIAAGVWLAFLPARLADFFKLVLLSYATAIFLGGIGTALNYFTQFSNLAGFIADISFNSFSLYFLIGSAVAFYALFKAAISWVDKRALRRQLCLSVKIFYGDRDVTFTALVDTGNSLRDPLSQAPVIVAEFNSIKSFLPDSMKLIFYENQEFNLDSLLAGAQESGFSGRLRMIPYESVGRKNGLLIGFRPDRVEIQNGKELKSLEEVVIGIYNLPLSSDGGYQGLMNPELIA